jgi:hypothetical protein
VAGADTAISGAIARTACRARFAVKRHVKRRRARRRPLSGGSRCSSMPARGKRLAGSPKGVPAGHGLGSIRPGVAYC